MPENTDRLQLIQRAAKRLGGMAEPTVAPPRPQREYEPPADLLDGTTVLEREPPLPAQQAAAARPAVAPTPLPLHQPLQSTPAAPTVSRRVRLNFSELRRNGMITPDNMGSSISHEFRNIKRKLLAGARDPKGQALVNNLVMVTSSLPGEGKTFTASNLAFSLAAERDLHVLLIDGDVIHPSLGALFEPTDGKGLTDLLNGSSKNVSDVMHRCSDVPNLSLIFAGRRDEATPELISSRRMADLCHDLSTRYSDRIVVIDTPPVLASSEPANIAAHVHHVLMVVAAGQPNRTQLQSALENISACRNVSLVFNKAPKWQQSHGDSYYYYYNNGAGGERAAGA